MTSLEDRAQQVEAFTQATENPIRRTITAVGIGVVTAGATYASYKTGLAPEVLGAGITPRPEAQPSIVDGFVVVNEGLREVAPVVTMGAIATGAYYYAAGKISSKSKTLNEMSKIEYSGMDDVSSNEEESSKLIGRAKSRTNAFRKGTGVAALSVLLTGATSGVEHEISNGPQRPIDAMYQVLAPGSEQRSMLLQSKNNTFMDDSDIERTGMDKLVINAQTKNITVVPFDKKLFNIDGKSALQVSIPDAVFTKATGESVGPMCETVPAIVDTTLGKEKGDTIDINGVDAQVVGVSKDIAQMNRSIAILPDTDMRKCIQNDTDTSYFGAIVPNIEDPELKNLVAQNPEVTAAAVSDTHFEDSNRKFWRANGTPILLQLIAYVGIFGGFAAIGERKNALQRNSREIGMLNAQGVDMKDVRRIEDRRALRETAKAAIIAAPAMPVMAGVFNMAELGLQVSTGFRELAVGVAVTGAAKVAGGRRAVKKFDKDQDLSLSVKG